MATDFNPRPKQPREPDPYEVEGIDVGAARPPAPAGKAPAPFVPLGQGVHCQECGYDHSGIATDAPCPECGAPRRRPNAGAPNLSEMPPGFIRLVQLGFLCTSVGAAYPIAAQVYEAFKPSLSRWPDAPVYANIVASALWVGGLWLASRRAPHETQRERSEHTRGLRNHLTLRTVSIGSQLGWVVASGAMTVGMSVSGAGWQGVMAWTAGVFGAIALAGVVPTALLVARAAEFAADTSLAYHLRNAVWGMCASTLLIALSRVVPPAYGKFVLQSFSALYWLLLIGSLLYFLYANVALLRLSTHAVAHARFAEARSLRLAERARVEALEEQRRRAAAPEPVAPDLYHYVATRPQPEDEPRRR